MTEAESAPRPAAVHCECLPPPDERPNTELVCVPGSLRCRLMKTFTETKSLYTRHVKGSPYSIAERRVPELIPVLDSPAGGESYPALGCHYFPPGLQLTSQPLEGCYQFRCLVNRSTMGVNSLPKTVTRQRRDCDLNPGLSAPESSTLTTRLPRHPVYILEA